MSVRSLVIAVVLLFPSEAHLSGSSHVHSDSKYFRVEMESVRVIFPRGSGDREGEWHREWKQEMQRRT